MLNWWWSTSFPHSLHVVLGSSLSPSQLTFLLSLHLLHSSSSLSIVRHFPLVTPTHTPLHPSYSLLKSLFQPMLEPLGFLHKRPPFSELIIPKNICKHSHIHILLSYSKKKKKILQFLEMPGFLVLMHTSEECSFFFSMHLCVVPGRCI